MTRNVFFYLSGKVFHLSLFYITLTIGMGKQVAVLNQASLHIPQLAQCFLVMN